jgi:hypothetical protein
MFYNLSSGPFLNEAALVKLAKTPFGTKIMPVADRYDEILTLKNDTITQIADSSLQTLRATFEQLSHGDYTIDAEELPTYLLPMIANAKKTYYATQYVLPEKFWGQYWAQKYFDLNVEAVKQRHINLVRIFIIDPLDGPAQRELLDKLIAQHIEKGIPIRLIETKEYLATHSDEDLRDILIVDGQLAGVLLLKKGGSFNRVQFSIDKGTIDKRQRNFDRLLAASIPYDQWKAPGK